MLLLNSIVKQNSSLPTLIITIGAENITYIKKNGGNLFDVTRCNTLHHLKCQEFI